MMFEQINIFEHVSDKQVKVYRCFRHIQSGGYWIQSIDYYNDQNIIEIDEIHQKNLVEHFMLEPPNPNKDFKSTIEAAIEAFNRDFSS
jgi:hypothetical protein